MKKQIIVGLLVLPGLAGAQQPGRSLSLQDAIRVAADASEQITIARAGIRRAMGEQYRARSEYLPQLGGSLSYTRTLKTEFSALSESSDTTSAPTPEACSDFNPNRLLPLGERVDSLESALRCRDNENPFGNIFSDLPFGRANQWNLGVSASQTVYSGGRVQAQNRIAAAGKRTAEIGLASANAQLVLDVTQAYYDAALSDQLYAIAEATMRQAETTLTQVKVARQVGDQPEFELLRAQVTHDNQRPVVIQRRSDRDLAHMRLKQLLNLPVEEILALNTRLQDDALPVLAISSAQTDTSSDLRAPVRQAMEAVSVQQALEAIARSQRLPNLVVSSQYGRVAYPGGGLPEWNSFRSNWTVTAGILVPIFTGGRLKGDALIAEANLLDARARLQQTRELAALDTRTAVERLRASEAAWQASAGTVEQATRAYAIAEIRFKEGISTQLELNDSRILLQQAQANRAIAARDVQVARARMALLPDLPVGGVGNGFGSAAETIQPQQAPGQNATQGRRAGN
ncbi:MAG: TolC family protein [Gemmatimonadota bacterium]